MTVFLTEGNRVFYVSILSLDCLVSGYTYGRFYYKQASMCHPCHKYYITVMVFVCSYIRTTLAHSCTTVWFGVIGTVWFGVIATV